MLIHPVVQGATLHPPFTCKSMSKHLPVTILTGEQKKFTFSEMDIPWYLSFNLARQNTKIWFQLKKRGKNILWGTYLWLALADIFCLATNKILIYALYNKLALRMDRNFYGSSLQVLCLFLLNTRLQQYCRRQKLQTTSQI